VVPQHPSISLVAIVQIINFPLCNITFSNTPSQLNAYDAVPRSVLGFALLVLVVIQALKQAFEMYKATKQWQLNQCIQHLVREGILYFVMCVLLFAFLSFSFIHRIISFILLSGSTHTKTNHSTFSSELLGIHFTTSLLGTTMGLQ
jgi:presenilin-like A22 family membrane protease